MACTPENAWSFERDEPPIPERKPAGPPLKMEEHIEDVQALLDWLNAHMEEHGAAVSRREDLELMGALHDDSDEVTRIERIIEEFEKRRRELGRYGLANIPFWIAEEIVWMEMKKQKGGKE